MTSTTYLSRDAAPQDFNDFKLGLAIALGLDELCLQPGAHSLDTPVAEVNYTYDPEKLFLAAQWRVHQGCVESAVETFFVVPKGQAAYTGASVRSWETTPVRQPTAPASSDLDWWLVSTPSAPVRNVEFASYVRLSSLLSKCEFTASAFPELTTRVAELEMDNDSLNQSSIVQSAELNELRRQIHVLKGRAEHWREMAGAPSEPEITDEAKYCRYDQVNEFMAEFDGKIALLPRFLNGLKKTTYCQPEDVFKALTFLATTYRECRTNLQSGDVMVKASEVYLGLTRAFGHSTPGTQGDAYFVDYNGHREPLEWHLKKGSDRDPTNCMRIYFLWCAASGRAVVGSGPTHLRNSGS